MDCFSVALSTVCCMVTDYDEIQLCLRNPTVRRRRLVGHEGFNAPEADSVGEKGKRGIEENGGDDSRGHKETGRSGATTESKGKHTALEEPGVNGEPATENGDAKLRKD